jgi:hypothetical protein
VVVEYNLPLGDTSSKNTDGVLAMKELCYAMALALDGRFVAVDCDGRLQ